MDNQKIETIIKQTLSELSSDFTIGQINRIGQVLKKHYMASEPAETRNALSILNSFKANQRGSIHYINPRALFVAKQITPALPMPDSWLISNNSNFGVNFDSNIALLKIIPKP